MSVLINLERGRKFFFHPCLDPPCPCPWRRGSRCCCSGQQRGSRWGWWGCLSSVKDGSEIDNFWQVCSTEHYCTSWTKTTIRSLAKSWLTPKFCMKTDPKKNDLIRIPLNLTTTRHLVWESLLVPAHHERKYPDKMFLSWSFSAEPGAADLASHYPVAVLHPFLLVLPQVELLLVHVLKARGLRG